MVLRIVCSEAAITRPKIRDLSADLNIYTKKYVYVF